MPADAFGHEHETLLNAIDASRLASTAMSLVEIPSPTGDSAEVAALFANRLEALGLEVEVIRELVGSQVIVARLRGTGGGPTLEFNGHLDTVPLRHDPPRFEQGRLYGRGAFDMKGQMAAFLEVIQALRDVGVALRGDLLVTAHSLHEYPGQYDHSEDRRLLLERGLVGDACLIPDSLEGTVDALALVYGGMASFTVELSRPGEPLHELEAVGRLPNPLEGLVLVGEALMKENRRFASAPHELLGPDTYHLGVLSGGDYFNRHTNRAVLQGTRRYTPEVSPADAETELRQIVQRCASQLGLDASVEFKGSQPYAVDQSDRFVDVLLAAQRKVTGIDLPIGGVRCGGDVTMFGAYGHGPAVNLSAHGGGHHGDVEWVDLADLTRLTKVYAIACVDYCGVATA